MRLGLLIKDTEYRKALAGKLANYDNDIFVNIIEGSNKDTSGSLVLTDIRPSELDEKVLKAIQPRTVFITDSGDGIPEGCHSLFKYSSIPAMISELSYLYNSWRGSGPGRDHSSRLIMICCDSDAYSSDRCLSVARQIIYRHGGSVLTVPLSYINDYGTDEGGSTDMFGRLMYSISTGRERETDSFTYTDSYGVSALMLPYGNNRLAYLDSDELGKLMSGLAARFDTVIGDVATCFREENISLMKQADDIIFFELGRRRTGLETLLAADESPNITTIRMTGETDEALMIDDCIKRMYGINNDESH